MTGIKQDVLYTTLFFGFCLLWIGFCISIGIIYKQEGICFSCGFISLYPTSLAFYMFRKSIYYYFEDKKEKI